MGNLDHLTGLAVFARVVQARSFSAAATQLGLSKSAVSKHIARLEEHLNARLLNRTTRRLSLTEVGAAFYERCTKVLAEVEEAEQMVTQLQTEPRGILRLSLPLAFGVLHIAPLLPAFLAQYPQVRVELAFNDPLPDPAATAFDVALRVGGLADSSLKARRLAPCRYVVCATPAYLDRYGIAQTPGDLERHNCLLDRLRPAAEWSFQDTDGGQQTVRVNGTVQADNTLALRELALHSAGIALLPTFAVSTDLVAGRLHLLLPDYQPLSSAIHALYPQTRHLTPKVRAFIDFLLECFGSGPYWDEQLQSLLTVSS